MERGRFCAVHISRVPCLLDVDIAPAPWKDKEIQYECPMHGRISASSTWTYGDAIRRLFQLMAERDHAR